MAGALAAHAVAVFGGNVQPVQSGAMNVPFALLASGCEDPPLAPPLPLPLPDEPDDENEMYPPSPGLFPDVPECVPHA
jgi:hypothetical protein